MACLLFGMLSLWALGMPLMSSPDEQSHVVKAAAVARGQWSGTLGPPPVDQTRPAAATAVELPADIAASVTLPNCYAFQPALAADCSHDLPPRTDDDVTVETYAGQYPPLYYLLVGWPSLLLSGETALYAMRLVSAAVSTAMIVWGAYRMRTAVPGWLGTWAAVVALSPMTLFLGATVNPIGLEIAAAFSFWAACLTIVSRPGPILTGAIVQAAVSGAVLVNVRASSPLWGLVVVVAVAAVAPPGRLRELARHRLTPWVAVFAGVAAAAAVAWVLSHGDTVSARDLFPEYADRSVALLAIAGRSYWYVEQMVGNFGWLDTPSPPVTLLAWFVGVGSLLLLALSVSARRRAKVVLAMLVATVLLAPLLQYPTVADAGLIWQGRYVLPIAVGVPLMAATTIGSRLAHGEDDLLRRVARGSLLVLLVGHVAAFYWASRRYSEGADGELFTVTPDWSSPVGYVTGVVLYAVLCLVTAAVAWRSTASRRLAGAPALEPATPQRLPAS